MPGVPSGRPWADRIFDLRVEDHPRPLEELRRLLLVARAYRHMNAGDLAIEKKDIAAAEREYGAAMKILPIRRRWCSGTPPRWPWPGRSINRLVPLFARSYALDPAWRTLVPRLPASGLLPADPAILSRIEKAGAPPPSR